MTYEFEGVIACPHCGCDYEGVTLDNIPVGPISCDHCNNLYTISARLKVLFSTHRVPCKGDHEYDTTRIHKIVVTEDEAQQWSHIGFLGRRDWQAHALWVRHCANCDHKETVMLPTDANCPWEDA